MNWRIEQDNAYVARMATKSADEMRAELARRKESYPSFKKNAYRHTAASCKRIIKGLEKALKTMEAK